MVLRLLSGRISVRHRRRCSCRNAPRPIFRLGAIRETGPRENTRCGMQASDLNRQLWTGETAHRSGSVPAARCSTCTAPRRCWCMCASHLGGRTRLKRKAVESGVMCSRHNIASSSGPSSRFVMGRPEQLPGVAISGAWGPAISPRGDMPKYRVLLFARRFSMSVTLRKSPNVKWLARTDTWQAYARGQSSARLAGKYPACKSQNGEHG
jgi:hypothetical protein